MLHKSVRIPSYLYRRNHAFYYRKRIPHRLSRFFSVSEIRYSLAVSTVTSAIQKANSIQFKTEQRFTTLSLTAKRIEHTENGNSENLAQLS